jgi:hypothetical protein
LSLASQYDKVDDRSRNTAKGVGEDIHRLAELAKKKKKKKKKKPSTNYSQYRTDAQKQFGGRLYYARLIARLSTDHQVLPRHTSGTLSTGSSTRINRPSGLAISVGQYWRLETKR